MTKKVRNKYHEEPPKPLLPKNHKQDQYISALKHDELIVSIGSAGTGKTFIPSTLFSDMYLKGDINQIVITRSTVECGNDLGALPGDLSQKFEPWILPITTTIKSRIGKGKFDCDVKNKNIQCIPVQYMRGMSLDNCGVIVDEAQNLTIEQVKMLITRIGYHCKMVFTGDTNQSDLRGNSGLAWLVRELRKQQTTGVDIIEFTWDDCQRSDTCKKMLRLIDRSEA